MLEERWGITNWEGKMDGEDRGRCRLLIKAKQIPKNRQILEFRTFWESRQLLFEEEKI